MIHYHVFAFNPFQENTYLIWNDKKDAWIVDPGCINGEEQGILKSFVENEKLSIQNIVLTHSHIDHVLGLHFCQKTWDVPTLNHAEDLETFKAIPQYAPMYGMPYVEGKEPTPSLEHGMELKLGEEVFDIRFVPGHAPGHVALVHHAQRLIFAGDVLFRGSIGRTDLPGGDFDTLAKSIQTELYSLDGNYTVFPGHGPETDLDFERSNNPFVKEI